LFRGRTTSGSKCGRKEGPGNESPLLLPPQPVLDRRLEGQKTCVVRKTGRKKGSKAGKKAGGNPQMPTYLSGKTQKGWLPAHEPSSGVSVEFQCEFTEKPERRNMEMDGFEE
jgi:hypothetical protein